MKFGEGRGICRVCGDKARDGRSYYCNEHRPEPKNPSNKRVSKEPQKILVDEIRETKPQEILINSVNDLADKHINKVPKVDDWELFLNPIVSWVFAMVIINVLAYRDQPDNTPEQNAELENLKNDLTPTDQDIKRILAPFNRVIAESKFNEKNGQKVLKNSDFIVAAVTMSGFIIRLRPVLNDRTNYKKQNKIINQQIEGLRNNNETAPIPADPQQHYGNSPFI